jgi:hypothetical protein
VCLELHWQRFQIEPALFRRRIMAVEAMRLQIAAQFRFCCDEQRRKREK